MRPTTSQKMRILAAAAFVAPILACVVWPDQTCAQTHNGIPISETRTQGVSGQYLRTGADLVLVSVTVTDQSDRLLMGLEKSNFKILDENERQTISHFSTEDAPISLGIIFDISSSMYGKIERSREAIVQFLRSSNPADEFFLVGFNDRPELLVDFTSSVDEIQRNISEAKPDGTTALLDAIYLGLDRMKRAHSARRALLIVSDGGDNHSRYTMKDLRSALLEGEVQVYAMGIFDEAPRTKAERMGPDLLGAVTGVTGGRTFPIRNLKKIGNAVDELALYLRNQYVIAYRPSNRAHNGRWHKVSVRVKAPQGGSRLHVYAKAGYYAPSK